MDPMDSHYQYVLIIILTSLIIAAGISVFFSTEPEHMNASLPLSHANDPGAFQSDYAENGSFIVRILWYDDLNRTYSFQDYPASERPDPDTYTYDGEPPAPGAKTAMIRFLSWDGSTERTLSARYVIDQETVTSILNRYSLTSSAMPLIPPSPSVTRTPEPSAPPIPGLLTPESGIICRNDDGSFTATFGYQSRHDYPVKLPVGEQNYFFPGDKGRGQPEIYFPGIHHEAFSITYPADATNQVWTLMGYTVSAGTVPEVNTSIHIDPQLGYAPLVVWFNEHSTGDTKDNPLTGRWNLGDGTITSKTGSFTHRYENPGVFVVTYTVQNRCSSVSATGTITLFQASYAWKKDETRPGYVKFHDTSGGDPSVWFWDFGDGYTSWEQNPVHSFAQPGEYRVGLTVSSPFGKGSVVQTVHVT